MSASVKKIEGRLAAVLEKAKLDKK